MQQDARCVIDQRERKDDKSFETTETQKVECATKTQHRLSQVEQVRHINQTAELPRLTQEARIIGGQGNLCALEPNHKYTPFQITQCPAVRSNRERYH